MRKPALIASTALAVTCLCCAGLSGLYGFLGYTWLADRPEIAMILPTQEPASEATSIPPKAAITEKPGATPTRTGTLPTSSPTLLIPSLQPESSSESATSETGDTYLPYQSSTGSQIASCLTADAKAEQAQVVRVIDGDTIEVMIGGVTYSVRYIGVDSPEVGFPLGEEALAQNANLVEGKEVLLITDVTDTDRYGRLLRYVFAGDVFVNQALVSSGYAMSKGYPPDIACQEQFDQSEKLAMTAALGLWAPTPVAAAGTSGESVSVVIQNIFFDGLVKRVESDEYAEISNSGQAAVDLAGWRLNAGNPGQDFVFPVFRLEPGQTCRVYTNESHAESCGFTYASKDALWNNKGDCGYLYNAGGELVDDYCY